MSVIVSTFSHLLPTPVDKLQTLRDDLLSCYALSSPNTRDHLTIIKRVTPMSFRPLAMAPPLRCRELSLTTHCRQRRDRQI